MYGYPLIPSLVEAAQRTVISPGISQRPIAVHGDHDGLLQGMVPPDAVTRALAVGSERIIALDPTFSPMQMAQAIEQTGPAGYPTTPSSPRLISLDTVNLNGGWQGSLDETQFDWLGQQLAEVVELLLRHPHVIAWMAGHFHHYAAWWYGDDVSGFWEFTTASIIDRTRPRFEPWRTQYGVAPAGTAGRVIDT